MLNLDSRLLQGKCPTDRVGNWAHRSYGRVLRGMLVVKPPVLVI